MFYHLFCIKLKKQYTVQGFSKKKKTLFFREAYIVLFLFEV